MTLQTTGLITMQQIATEATVTSTGFNLNSADARKLANKQTNPISFSDFYGKTYVAPAPPPPPP